MWRKKKSSSSTLPRLSESDRAAANIRTLSFLLLLPVPPRYPFHETCQKNGWMNYANEWTNETESGIPSPGRMWPTLLRRHYTRRSSLLSKYSSVISAAVYYTMNVQQRQQQHQWIMFSILTAYRRLGKTIHTHMWRSINPEKNRVTLIAYVFELWYEIFCDDEHILTSIQTHFDVLACAKILRRVRHLERIPHTCVCRRSAERRGEEPQN